MVAPAQGAAVIFAKRLDCGGFIAALPSPACNDANAPESGAEGMRTPGAAATTLARARSLPWGYAHCSRSTKDNVRVTDGMRNAVALSNLPGKCRRNK